MEKYYINKEDALLLVIDIQKKLFPAMANQERLRRQTNLLLQLARVLELPVVVTEQNPKGLGPTIDSLEMAGLPVETVTKMTFSAAVPELLAVLASHKRKQIIVVGIETHVCVFQTVRDLQRQGYQCYLVSDAADSRTELNYRTALDLMREMGAVITSAEIVTFDLLGRAGTPEFKQILTKVK